MSEFRRRRNYMHYDRQVERDVKVVKWKSKVVDQEKKDLIAIMSCILDLDKRLSRIEDILNENK